MRNQPLAQNKVDLIAWWISIIWCPANLIYFLISVLNGTVKPDPAVIYSVQPGNTLLSLILPIAIAVGLIVFHRVKFKLAIVTWFLISTGCGLMVELWQYGVEGLQQRYFGYMIAVPIGFFIADYLAHTTAVQILGKLKGYVKMKGFLPLALLTGLFYSIIGTNAEFVCCDELDLWRWTIYGKNPDPSVLYKSIPSTVPLGYFTISLTISAFRYWVIGNPFKAAGRDSWPAAIPCIALWVGYAILNLRFLSQGVFSIGLALVDLLFIALVIWSLTGSSKIENSMNEA